MPRLGRRKQLEEALPHLPRLELELRKWEDMWFIIHVSNLVRTALRQPPVCGNTVPWRQFRDFLLRVQTPGRTGVLREAANFLPPMDAAPAITDSPLMIAFPRALTLWCADSRRIYKLDSALQAILRATSLDSVTWRDLQPPFGTFAVELAEAYRHPDGRDFNFVMVTHSRVPSERLLPLDWAGKKPEENKVVMDLVLLSKDQYKPLTPQQTQRLDTLVERHLYNQVAEELQNLGKRFIHADARGGIQSLSLIPLDDDEPVTQTADKLAPFLQRPGVDQQTVRTLIDAMIRIIVGLELYLKSLPSGSPHISPPTKPFRSGLLDRKVITNRWEVCNVTSVVPLTREERIFYGIEGNQEEQRQAKYELSCHFREGHWRRPPDKGDDPAAPRTVHVRPCIVRRDRLPKDGGLPAGAAKSDAD